MNAAYRLADEIIQDLDYVYSLKLGQYRDRMAVVIDRTTPETTNEPRPEIHFDSWPTEAELVAALKRCPEALAAIGQPVYDQQGTEHIEDILVRHTVERDAMFARHTEQIEASFLERTTS